jgi:hypothetical protein
MLLEGLASIVLPPEHTLRAAMGDMVAAGQCDRHV